MEKFSTLLAYVRFFDIYTEWGMHLDIVSKHICPHQVDYIDPVCCVYMPSALCLYAQHIVSICPANRYNMSSLWKLICSFVARI